MVLLALAKIYHWMDIHGFRQFQLAGIVSHHPEHWEWSYILGFEGVCLSLELKILGRQQNPIYSLDFDCPLVLVSCGLVLGLGLLKLLPYSLPYCLPASHWQSQWQLAL